MPVLSATGTSHRPLTGAPFLRGPLAHVSGGTDSWVKLAQTLLAIAVMIAHSDLSRASNRARLEFEPPLVLGEPGGGRGPAPPQMLEGSAPILARSLRVRKPGTRHRHRPLGNGSIPLASAAASRQC
jgi:hypothetical protein